MGVIPVIWEHGGVSGVGVCNALAYQGSEYARYMDNSQLNISSSHKYKYRLLQVEA